MNEDAYAECLVKQKNSPWRIPVIILAGILAIGSFILMIRNAWGFIAFIAVVLLIWFFWRYLKVEYEYVFVTDEISFDAIYSQATRKTKKKVLISTIETVEETNAERNKQRMQGNNMVYIDYSSKEKDHETYTMIFSDKEKHCILVFEPDEKFLKTLWRAMPSKVHMKRS